MFYLLHIRRIRLNPFHPCELLYFFAQEQNFPFTVRNTTRQFYSAATYTRCCATKSALGTSVATFTGSNPDFLPGCAMNVSTN